MSVYFPHNTNSTAAVQKYEVAVPSQFNAHFVLQGTLKDKLGDYGYLSEYVKSVNGLFIEYAGNTIEAGYKTTKFRYDSNEKQTFYDIEVSFQNFLDNDSRQLVYNGIAAWSREKFNPMTAERGLKKHYANACLVVEKYNRDETVYWRRMAHNVFPMSDINDQTADNANHDMTDLTITFNADWVSDITNDPRLATK